MNEVNPRCQIGNNQPLKNHKDVAQHHDLNIAFFITADETYKKVEKKVTIAMTQESSAK